MDEVLQKHGCSTVFNYPEGLREMMSDISREVLREQPANLYEFIANYLSVLLITREHGILTVRLLDDLCDCRPSVSEQLMQIGLKDPKLTKISNIIKSEMERFDPGKGKGILREFQTVQKILDLGPLDEEMISKVSQVARNAFRDYCYRKKVLEKKLTLDPEAPWEVAASHTLDIYKTTKPSFAELSRASKRIQILSFQAAYRGYYIRKKELLNNVAHPTKDRPKCDMPVMPQDIAGSREAIFGPRLDVTDKLNGKDNLVTSLYDAAAAAKLHGEYDPLEGIAKMNDVAPEHLQSVAPHIKHLPEAERGFHQEKRRSQLPEAPNVSLESLKERISFGKLPSQDDFGADLRNSQEGYETRGTRRSGPYGPSGSRPSGTYGLGEGRPSLGFGPDGARTSRAYGPGGTRVSGHGQQSAADGSGGARHSVAFGPRGKQGLDGNYVSEGNNEPGGGRSSQVYSGRNGSRGSRHSGMYGRGGSRQSEGYGPGGRRHSEGYSPRGSQQSEGYGPGGRRCSEGYGPRGSQQSESYGPGGRRYSEGYGPRGSEQSEGYGPEGPRYSERYGPRGSQQSEGYGPGGHRHSEESGPREQKEWTSDQYIQSGVQDVDECCSGATSSRLSREHGPGGARLSRKQGHHGAKGSKRGQGMEGPRDVTSSGGAEGVHGVEGILEAVKEDGEETNEPNAKEGLTRLEAEKGERARAPGELYVEYRVGVDLENGYVVTRRPRIVII